MRFWFQSIRWRMQVWHGFLLFAVLAALSGACWFLVRQNRLEQEDSFLLRQVSFLTDISTRGGPGGRGRRPPPEGEEFWERGWERGGDGPPRRDEREPRFTPNYVSRAGDLLAAGAYFLAWDGQGQRTEASANAPADLPRPKTSAAGSAVSRLHFREYAKMDRRGNTILVGRDISPIEQDMQRLAWLLGGAGAGILALGLAGGWWISGHTLRPISDISRAAERIAAGNLKERISTRDARSELGQLARVLNETFGQLQESFDRQARFTADASHELRTPVAILRAQTESILARPRSPEEYREALEACQRAGDRMAKTTESLMILARLDAGDQTLTLEVRDVARLAAEAAEMLHPLAAKRSATVTLHLAEATCRCDPQAITQVITNLLTNALNHNPPGTSVTVTTAAEADMAVITVEDNGPGVTAEDLPHVFDRFYRADKSRSSARSGAGLGLAICKAIVEAHDGSITMRVGEAGGTTVEARLAISDGAQDQPDARWQI